ncbi:hypothetical protein [Heliophilum fasciatum]|uniref:Uncharacterized protein n=1 Tax=Heliophilum fasciatum TaxID=35700 RepID=A0A4V2SY60_9FIRM|nr:hypothetical protein [Heliophilum fasciatum]MCW2276743.1 uncharacterized protein YoxC [Heliophilum fasciatum]TCP68876.1 hypothetical protein EDD73_10137 [Heliophilum fasciatum]
MNLQGDMTVVQAAKATGLQRYTIREAIHRGELVARQQKIAGGFMYMVSVEALREFGRRRGITSPILGLEAVDKFHQGAPDKEETTTPGELRLIPLAQSPFHNTNHESAGTETASSKTESTAQQKGSRKETVVPGDTVPELSGAAVTQALNPNVREDIDEENRLIRENLSKLVSTMPAWEEKMEQLLEQIVEVQSDVLGLKKGVHQHLSKVEGRMATVQNTVTGEVRSSLERLRHNISEELDDVHAGMSGWQSASEKILSQVCDTLEQVAAGQSDTEMRQTFVHKLAVDNQATVNEVKKVMLDFNESLKQIASSQEKGAEKIAKQMDDVKVSVDGVKRSVDRSTEMIMKWRQRMLVEQNQRGVRNWFQKLWNRNPAYTK